MAPPLVLSCPCQFPAPSPLPAVKALFNYSREGTWSSCWASALKTTYLQYHFCLLAECILANFYILVITNNTVKLFHTCTNTHTKQNACTHLHKHNQSRLLMNTQIGLLQESMVWFWEKNHGWMWLVRDLLGEESFSKLDCLKRWHLI